MITQKGQQTKSQKPKSVKFEIPRERPKPKERELSEFQIIQKLGQGSFGTAYKVRDEITGLVIVLKQIPLNPNDPSDYSMKLRECNVMRRIFHPNVVRFKQHFKDKNHLCIIFDHCDKGDLSSYLKNQKGQMLSETRIKKFILELILGVEYLHGMQIIHRDLKPSNIFLKNKDYCVQIGDFGIAASGNENGCCYGEDVGTLAYQAPEMFDGTQYDYRVDIWSIGCIIYQLCNFDYPFVAPTEQKMIEKVKQMPPRQLDQRISQEIRDIYDICLNKNCQTRPQAVDLLGLEIVQKWAKDLGLMNQQLLNAQRLRKYDLLHFQKATKEAQEAAILQSLSAEECDSPLFKEKSRKNPDYSPKRMRDQGRGKSRNSNGLSPLNLQELNKDFTCIDKSQHSSLRKSQKQEASSRIESSSRDTKQINDYTPKNDNTPNLRLKPLNFDSRQSPKISNRKSSMINQESRNTSQLQVQTASQISTKFKPRLVERHLESKYSNIRPMYQNRQDVNTAERAQRTQSGMDEITTKILTQPVANKSRKEKISFCDGSLTTPGDLTPSKHDRREKDTSKMFTMALVPNQNGYRRNTSSMTTSKGSNTYQRPNKIVQIQASQPIIIPQKNFMLNETVKDWSLIRKNLNNPQKINRNEISQVANSQTFDNFSNLKQSYDEQAMILNLKKIAKENERYAISKRGQLRQKSIGQHLPSIPGAFQHHFKDNSEAPQGPVIIDGFLHQTQYLLKSNQTKVKKLEISGVQNLKIQENSFQIKQSQPLSSLNKSIDERMMRMTQQKKRIIGNGDSAHLSEHFSMMPSSMPYGGNFSIDLNRSSIMNDRKMRSTRNSFQSQVPNFQREQNQKIY